MPTRTEPTHSSGPVQNTSLAAAPLLPWSSVERRRSFKAHQRGRKHTQAAPAPGWAPRLLQFWSEVYLATLLVMVVRVRELERRAGEDEGLARCDDVSSGGGRPPAVAPVKKKASRGIGARVFPLPQLRDLPVWSSPQLVLPLWWPVKTRINVFVLTCSSVSSWRLAAPSMNIRLHAWCLVQCRLPRVLACQPAWFSCGHRH